LFLFKLSKSHINFNRTIFNNLWLDHSCQSPNIIACLLTIFILKFLQELCHAPKSIPTHLRLSSIRVINSHLVVTPVFALKRKYDPITANTEIAVAQQRGLIGRDRWLPKSSVVDEDKVITYALVLSEVNLFATVTLHKGRFFLR